MHDLIIVGSGPAGFAAAFANKNKNVLVIDPSLINENTQTIGTKSLLESKMSGTAEHNHFIGNEFESLHNINGEYLSPKLKAPHMRFITDGSDKWSPVRSTSFLACVSLARGGLANAWGAGAFRYDKNELATFPFPAKELDHHYDELIKYIGVTGSADDLLPTFGSADGHLPPPKLGQAGMDLASRYNCNREWMHKRGLRIGLARLALLTQNHRGHEPYQYNGMEFFYPHRRDVFNPGHSILDLAASGNITYRKGILIERFQTNNEGVEIFGRHTIDGSPCRFQAKQIALAAGAINTARIVLASARDHKKELPIRDNPISYIPLLDPRRIGYPHDNNCLPAQAACVLEDGFEREPIQMTFYGLNTTLWGDLAFDMPLPSHHLPRAIRSLLPAMRIIQLFYPDTKQPRGSCCLASDGALEINYHQIARGSAERRTLHLMRKLGYYGHPRLCKYPIAGNSFHYAGTLPMRNNPTDYETNPDGMLFAAPGVYIIDAANFPSLPSKNLTLTIMANSLRIAKKLLANS